MLLHQWKIFEGKRLTNLTREKKIYVKWMIKISKQPTHSIYLGVRVHRQMKRGWMNWIVTFSSFYIPLSSLATSATLFVSFMI